MSKQPTCEERIDAQLASRLEYVRALQHLSTFNGGDSLSDSEHDLLEEIGWNSSDAHDRSDEANESAREALQELPLAVSSQTVFRIDLSTGGPGDWLEVRCSGDTPAYEGGDGAYSIEEVSYHFNDWFDHAERNLTGAELETAEAFAREIVPELVE